MKINSSIFQNLRNETSFIKIVSEFYSDTGLSAGLKLQSSISKYSLYEAWESWGHDMGNIAKNSMAASKNKKQPEPDHFKHAGTLAFWLRRTSPIIMDKITLVQHDIQDDYLTVDDNLFMLDYTNEYFAFIFGLELCNFFERQQPEYTEPKITKDYIQMLCYFLKYKHVSPHAMIMIYRSLFL